MEVKASACERLLRLEIVSAANLGSAMGEASLDRPTQKDAWFALPFLPDSALKGVLAAPFGNVLADSANENRERLFGSPDRAARRGKPGPLIVGNGELLAFPLPLREGGAAWVFPALAVARFLRLTEADAEAGPALDLLCAIESAPDGRLAYGWPRLPELVSPLLLEPLPPARAAEGGDSLVDLLRHLAGAAVPERAALVATASATAGVLWRAAAERRVLTALDSERRTAAHGTLRAAELIPPGTLFLSWVSLQDGAELPISARLQIGAWEGSGLGWARTSFIGRPSAAPGREQRATVQAAPAADLPPRPLDEPAVMRAMHTAIERLREQGEAEVRDAVWSSLGPLGLRVHTAGLEAALAFELAKAKLAHLDPKPEARAHRWLLTALLDGTPDPRPPRGPSRPLLAWLGEPPRWPVEVADRRHLILARWRWLRRFAELGLDDLEPPPTASRAAGGASPAEERR